MRFTKGIRMTIVCIKWTFQDVRKQKKWKAIGKAHRNTSFICFLCFFSPTWRGPSRWQRDQPSERLRIGKWPRKPREKLCWLAKTRSRTVFAPAQSLAQNPKVAEVNRAAHPESAFRVCRARGCREAQSWPLFPGWRHWGVAEHDRGLFYLFFWRCAVGVYSCQASQYYAQRYSDCHPYEKLGAKYSLELQNKYL